MSSGGGKAREEGTALLGCCRRLVHVFIDYLPAVGGLALVSDPRDHDKLSLSDE